MKKIQKIVVTFLIMILTINFITINNVSANVQDVDIMSETNLTVEVAKKWAKSKNATDTFIDLADLYWKFASVVGGVNPVAAYVQAALETGYGKFGGVLDESYFNPCGMKATLGMEDDNPNAHYRFGNWEEGVRAHLEHLALYAGADGYPLAFTYDPRHFGFLLGTAKTIKGLEGRWATAVGYGDTLLKLYNDFVEFSKTVLISRISIDTPDKIEGDILEVRGWALDDQEISAINVYIDGVFKGTASYGKPRMDVYGAYPEYNNKNSGYTATINTSSLGTGNKILKVEQVAKDGSKSSTQKVINISSTKSRLAIDSPINNAKVADDKTLEVKGWVLNAKEISKINIYIDGNLLGTATTGIKREDVQKSFPGYSKAATSGYVANIDISKISNGVRTLKVEQVAIDGSKSYEQRNINVSKLLPKTAIDTPSSFEGDTLEVKGWALNTKEISAINIYIDGVFKGTAKYGIARSDVNKVYPEYLNANSGYSATIKLDNLGTANKVIKVEQVAKDGSKSSTQKTINISKTTSRTAIDSPVVNAKVADDRLLEVKGWALNTKKISAINIYIDGTLVGTTKTGIIRGDVQKIFPSYSNANTSGYVTNVDISKISNGVKTLKVEQVAVDGSKSYDQRKINISRVLPKIEIDTPSSFEGDNLEVRGWALNTKEISAINVYIDGVFKGTANYGIARTDVYIAYPEYVNRNSGYSMSINATNLGSGTKILKVEQVAKDGSKTSTQKVINISSITHRMALDVPVENAKVGEDATLSVSGWALNNKEILSISVYLDGVFMGGVGKAEAEANIPRADVQKAYPGYSGAATSGFSYSVKLGDIGYGNKTLEVVQFSADGSKQSVIRQITITNLVPLVCIDTPSDIVNPNGSELIVSGWALNKAGINKVKVYIDGERLDDAEVGLIRNDVAQAYPEYPNSSKSGYRFTFPLNRFLKGKHTIEIIAIGNDGTSVSTTKTFIKGTGLKIVVDPGHNYGGDGGAVSTFGGITYYERDLNMKVSVYLKKYLEDQGYIVTLTRESSDRDVCDVNTSLAKRVSIANNNNADLFISIHHNAFTSASAHGVETYYYNDNSSRVAKSKDLAKEVVEYIAPTLGFYNRGYKESPYYVLKNTKMPAILVECGFITNEQEVSILAKDATHQTIARAITRSVTSIFG